MIQLTVAHFLFQKHSNVITDIMTKKGKFIIINYYHFKVKQTIINNKTPHTYCQLYILHTASKTKLRIKLILQIHGFTNTIFEGYHICLPFKTLLFESQIQKIYYRKANKKSSAGY